MTTIIPAIDLIGGECVRLTEGDYSRKKVYYTDPLEMALRLEEEGFSFLHLVDLDNAREGQIKSLEVLQKLAANTNLTIDYGGGIKSIQDVNRVLEAGAAQVNCGSMAVHNREEMSRLLREMPENIILSADVLNGKIATGAWLDHSDLDLEEFIDYYVSAGLRYVTSTDISKDGKLEGPAFEMYSTLRSRFPQINICASGGVTSLEDIKTLRRAGIDRIIVGKAIYEGRIDLKELKDLDDA